MPELVKNNPVTLTMVALAAITFGAARAGVNLSPEEAAAYLAGAAVVVNSRHMLVDFIRETKRYLRELVDAARS